MSYLAEYLAREQNIAHPKVLAGSVDICLMQIWQALAAGDIAVSGSMIIWRKSDRWTERIAELASLALEDAGNDGEAFVAWLADWVTNGSWRERWERRLAEIRAGLSR